MSWTSPGLHRLSSILLVRTQPLWPMAAYRISDTIEARTRNHGVQEAIAFLNACPDREECRISRDVRSLYSVVRGCYHRLRTKLLFTEEEEVQLQVGDTYKTIPLKAEVGGSHCCPKGHHPWMLQERNYAARLSFHTGSVIALNVARGFLHHYT